MAILNGGRSDRPEEVIMYIGNRLRFVDDYLRRRVEMTHFPISLEIEVTNRCNEDCIMCPRSRLTRPFASLPMELLEKVLSEVDGRVELINLFHFGEPLLHPQLADMIRRCKARRIRVLVTTNGTLLNEKRALELIDSGLDMLVISLDAATESVYSQIRRIADFQKVLLNVETWLGLKRRLGAGPYTQVQMVSLNQNRKELRAFVQQWRRKADSVRVKPFYNTANIGLSINEPSRVRARARPCILLWREPVILCDGTVLPCCVDMIGERPLGNIREKSLMEIWNDRGFVEMRQKHLEGRHREIDICRNCHVFELPWPFVAGSMLFNDMTLRKIGASLDNLQTVGGLSLNGSPMDVL